MWLGRRAEAARFDGPGHSGRWPALLCLVVIPALLHLPIWRYSLATPFALVDDYGNWFFTLVDDYGNRHYLRALDSFAEFQTWLVAIFDLPDGRYRPFWDLSNVVAWALYGDNPWAHHLSRWFFHIATAILFCAAFLRFHDIRSPLPALRAGALAHGVRLVPPATFLYVLLFTPNLPAARLAPQEVHTVFFLSFCTLAAALTLAPSGAPTSKARRGAYILLLFGVLGLASCKETNVAIVLWIWLASMRTAFWRGRSPTLGDGTPPARRCCWCSCLRFITYNARIPTSASAMAGTRPTSWSTRTPYCQAYRTGKRPAS